MPSHRSPEGLFVRREVQNEQLPESRNRTGQEDQAVPAGTRHLVEPLRTRAAARAARQGPAPRLAGVLAGAASLIRGASPPADQARSASRHGTDRAPGSRSGSAEPLGEGLPRRSDALASNGHGV